VLGPETPPKRPLKFTLGAEAVSPIKVTAADRADLQAPSQGGHLGAYLVSRPRAAEGSTFQIEGVPLETSRLGALPAGSRLGALPAIALVAIYVSTFSQCMGVRVSCMRLIYNRERKLTETVAMTSAMTR
jgi:hypothetical protein